MDSTSSTQTSRRCPVHQHAAYYAAQADGLLTTASMTEGHDKQSISDGVSIKCWAITNMMTERKIDGQPADLARVVNPARSGLWDEKGEWDEQAYGRLVSHYARDLDDGKRVVTREAFGRFVTDERKRRGEPSKLGNATKLGWVVPVAWVKVTEGSIGELFRYYADCWVRAEDSTYEAALTVEQIKRFYTNPVAVSEARAQGKLPVQRPDQQ